MKITYKLDTMRATKRPSRVIIKTHSGKVTRIVTPNLHTAKSLAGKAIHKRDKVFEVQVFAGNNKTIMRFTNGGDKSTHIAPKRHI